MSGEFDKVWKRGQGKMTVNQVKDMLSTLEGEQDVAIQLENGQLYSVDSVDITNSAAGPVAAIKTGILLGSAGPEGGGEGAF